MEMNNYTNLHLRQVLITRPLSSCIGASLIICITKKCKLWHFNLRWLWFLFWSRDFQKWENPTKTEMVLLTLTTLVFSHAFLYPVLLTPVALKGPTSQLKWQPQFWPHPLSLQFTSWASCLWIELCVPRNSLIFLAFAVQISALKH